MAIWTPHQLAALLHVARGDRLRALWWLIALRGLRRGEAVALRWTDLDLDTREAWICRARTSAGYRVHEGPPKTAAGTRTIALDKKTVAVLRRHTRRQQAEQAATRAASRPWYESGYVFTRPDGSPLHPDYVSQRFRLLVVRSGLPPIRLHDLRHGAATLAHTADADLKTVQDQLGHASIGITSSPLHWQPHPRFARPSGMPAPAAGRASPPGSRAHRGPSPCAPRTSRDGR